MDTRNTQKNLREELIGAGSEESRRKRLIEDLGLLLACHWLEQKRIQRGPYNCDQPSRAGRL